MAKQNPVTEPPFLTAAPDDTRWLERDQSLDGKQTRQLYQRLRALYALAEAVHRSDNYERISSLALDFFQKLLTPERAILAIHSADGVVSVQGRDIDAGIDPANWPVSQNLLRRVRSEHVAVLSTDAREDAILSKFGSVGSLNIRSVLCVPLGTRQSPRGLIYLDSRMEAGIFDQDDLYFLTAVCRLLDTAIESIDRVIEQARQAERARKQIEMLRGELFEKHQVVGRSKLLLDAYERLKAIASKTGIPILLRGETGTGKEHFARMVHYFAGRSGRFVPVSLAANVELVESTLFGHVKGAFTGATYDHVGFLEEAHGGTLFLDEVADIPPQIQSKLLRVLQEKEFRPLGSKKSVHSDFRLVSATSRSIETMADMRSYREDLLYRFGGVTITLPPLRERTDDIPLLVEHFLEQHKMRIQFSEPAMQFLIRQPWPGNIRDLQNKVIAAAALAKGDNVDVEDVRNAMNSDPRSVPAEDEQIDNIAELLKRTERNHMLKALSRTKGNAAGRAYSRFPRSQRLQQILRIRVAVLWSGR